MTFSTLTAGTINGLLLGGLYAIAALGLSMVFGVMRLVNIAHGELLILVAYLNFVIASALGLDPFITTLLVIPILFVLGYALQRWLFNPLMGSGMEPALLSAFGLSIIAQNAFISVWGVNTRAITTSYTEVGLQILGIRVPLLYVVAFGLSILLIVGMHLFISRTYMGKAIRAATHDIKTAQVLGINVNSVFAFTFAIAASTTALGGMLIGMIFSFVPASGFLWLLKGFVVVVLGGMGNILGTLAGGLVLGTAEGFGAAIVGTGYRDMIGYLIFLIVLTVRPRGLFGKAGSE